MGLAKPSLYAAFGDKRSLFLRATEEFARRVGDRIRVAFERSDTLEGSLREALLEAVDIYLGGQAPPGCLIVNGSTTEAIADEGLAQFSREFFAKCDHVVARWIARRITEEGGVSALVLSRLFNGVIHDIAIRARVGESRTELRAYARGAAVALSRAAR